MSESGLFAWFQKAYTSYFVAICKNEIASTQVIMQVKPGRLESGKQWPGESGRKGIPDIEATHIHPTEGGMTARGR